MIAIKPAAERATANTDARINRQIERRTAENVAACAELGSEAIN